MGDFTITRMKFDPPEYLIFFSGETVIEGEYRWEGEERIVFLVDDRSKGRIPRLKGDEGLSWIFLEFQGGAGDVLTPQVPIGQKELREFRGLDGRATIAIADYVLQAYASKGQPDSARLVRVLEKPARLRPSAWAQVSGTGSCLNLRASPGLRAPIVTCLADGTIAQVTRGPEDMDGLRWWHLVVDVLDDRTITGHLVKSWVKGWAAEDFLRYHAEGTLSFKRMNVGNRFGEFTLEQIRGFRGYLPSWDWPGLNLLASFSGQTVVSGEFSPGSMCGWVFEVAQDSSSKIPRVPGEQEHRVRVLIANQEGLNEALAPGLPWGEEFLGVRVKATVLMADVVLALYPFDCAGQIARLVKVIERDWQVAGE